MAEPATYNNTPIIEEPRSNPLAWIIPLLLIAAAIGIYAYYQNRNQSAPQPQTQTSNPASTSQNQNQPVNDAAGLSAATAGTKASLSNISISQVVSGRIFTIKAGDQTIYTILSPNVSLPNTTTLKSGQQVAITGTLVSTNSDQYKNLNLTAAEQSALSKQSLVLLVDQVTISGSNATSNPNTNSSNQ